MFVIIIHKINIITTIHLCFCKRKVIRFNKCENEYNIILYITIILYNDYY